MTSSYNSNAAPRANADSNDADAGSKPEKSLWKERPEDWKKIVQGSVAHKPVQKAQSLRRASALAAPVVPARHSYPFWLCGQKESTEPKTPSHGDPLDKVLAIFNKKPDSEPKKLYHFLHVENQRIQLQQETWKILMAIMEQDKKVLEAKADVEKAAKQWDEAEDSKGTIDGVLGWTKDQLVELEKQIEAEDGHEQQDKDEKHRRKLAKLKGKQKKLQTDCETLNKKLSDENWIVEDCEKDHQKKTQKWKVEGKKKEDLEKKFINHLKKEVPYLDIEQGEDKDAMKSQFFVTTFVEDDGSIKAGNNDGNTKTPRYAVGKEWQYAYAYGAVGDLPMHTCFLLGLVDLGKKVIEELFMYEGLDLISLPYIDDTKAWKIVGTKNPLEGIVQDIISEEDSEKYYDGGLFTGETVLHIAIVQNSSHEDLVPWLLERNCNVVARAHGAFFKPKTFYLPSDKNPEKNKGDWFFRPLISLMEGFERRLGWGRRVDANKKQVEKRVAGHKNRRRIENLDSACDYGELPLSFAASVGRLDVCKALLKHVMSGIVEDEDAREEQERSYIRELEEIYKREEKTTKDWKTFIKSCREKYPKSKSKIRPFENKTWKEFVEVTREQLMAQNIELGHKKRTAEMREEFLKNLTEMPVDTQLAEDGVAQKMEKMFQEVKDNHCQKVTFYFVNASVDNFYYQEGTQHKIRYGGNTALHMAVYHRQTDVIKWLMEKGAEPSLKFMNEHNLTPFTLAAKQGYVEIFDVLTDYMRQKSWVYGQVQMSLLSLEQLDSFRIGEFPLHQNTAWQSAIEVIVFHEVDAFVNNKIFNKLIKEKWEKFGRWMYIKRTLLPYIVLLAIFCAYMFVRCHQINQEWQNSIAGGRVFEDSGVVFIMRLQLGDARPEDAEALASFILHGILVLGSFWLFWKGLRQKHFGPFWRWRKGIGKLNIESLLFKNMAFILDIASALLLIISFLFRVFGMPEAELDIMAVLSIFMWSNLLNLIMPFKFFGIMAITTYKMLVGDVLRFLMVFVVTTMAFSLAMTVLYQRSEDPDNVEGMDIPGNSILNLIWASLGQVDNYANIARTRNFSLTITVHIAYCILQTILMLNLLIAMMSRTFNASMDDTHKTWIFPFAQTVLRYEKLLDPKDANMAKNRCGEANQGDVAAMTEADIKRAKFYIVDVGEDQVLKEAKLAALTQEKEHAMIIESVNERLKKWEEEENKKAKGDEKEEGKDDVDETTLKEHIDEKLMRLQSVIKELTGRDKERAGLDEPGKVPQNQEPEASEDRVLNESNGQDLHAHRGDDSQDQYAHRGGGKSEPGHSPSEGQTQDLRHDGPGRNQHECVVTPEQPRAEGTLQSAATEATVLQSAAAEATALQSAATEATVLQSAATEATALQSAAAEGTALQSAAAEATVLQSAAAEGTAAVLQSAAAEGTVLQSAATEGKVQEKPPGQAAVVRTHRKLKPLPPQGPGLNMKPTSLTRRTDATRTGLGGPRACSEAGSEIEN